MKNEFPPEADGERITNEVLNPRTERLLVHPRSTEGQMRPEPMVIDWMDDLELSHDRHLMLLQIDREHPDDPPLLIEEYDSSQELDDLSHGGNVRLYPEDLPRLIAWLET